MQKGRIYKNNQWQYRRKRQRHSLLAAMAMTLSSSSYYSSAELYGGMEMTTYPDSAWNTGMESRVQNSNFLEKRGMTTGLCVRGDGERYTGGDKS